MKGRTIMAMSSKHYREAASVIASAVSEANDRGSEHTDAILRTVEVVADGLARMFKADNSAFNRATFFDACNLTDRKF